MAHDVFVSYANEDKATADALVAALEQHQIRCWIAPRDVVPGQDYAEMLIEAIGDAQVMVLVFSSNSNNSPHVMREVERAANKGVAMLPLRIEDVAPSRSMEYFISRTHWLDALTPPLKQHLDQLARSVAALLAASPGTVTEREADEQEEEQPVEEVTVLDAAEGVSDIERQRLAYEQQVGGPTTEIAAGLSGPSSIPAVSGSKPAAAGEAPAVAATRLDRVELRRQGLCFRAYPVWLMALLSIVTFGIYTVFWLNHWHGLMPKRRADDPSTARAIGFLFIPLYNLYWLFESLLRLCTRLDEELADAGLPDRVPKELVRWFCILYLVPYVNVVASPILGAIAAARLQSLVNLLARFDLTEPSGS